MSDQLKVEASVMIAMANTLKSRAGGMGEILDDLESKTKGLRERWSGEAQQSYDSAQLSWNRTAKQMADFIRRVGDVTIEITETHTGHDRRSVGSFDLRR